MGRERAMGKHEEKQCEGCDSRFECKVGNIIECECFEVNLSTEQREVLSEKFSDCVCSSCLRDIAKQSLSKEAPDNSDSTQ